MHHPTQQCTELVFAVPRSSRTGNLAQGGGRAKKLVADLLTNAIGRNAGYLVTLVTIPIIARTLSVAEFGEFALSQGAYFFGSALVDFGLTIPLAGRVSSLDPPAVAALRRDYLLLRLGLLGGVALSGMGIFASSWWFYIWLGLCAGALSSCGEEWLYLARSRFAAVVATQWAGRLVYLGGVVVWMLLRPEPWVPIVCLGVGGATTSGLQWLKAGQPLPRVFDQDRSGGTAGGVWSAAHGAFRLARFGWPLLLSRLVSAVYSQGSALLVALRLAGSGLGFYAAADRVIRAAQGIFDSLILTLVPRMARRASVHAVTPATVVFLATSGALGAGLGALAIVVAAPTIVNLLYGAEYGDVVPVLRYASAILPFAALTSTLTTNVLMILQKARHVLAVYVCGASVAVIGILLLPDAPDPSDAVLRLVAAEASAALVAFVFALRVTSSRGGQARRRSRA